MRFPLIILLPFLVALAGCAAMSGVEPTDLSFIRAGVTEADVEQVLGKPVAQRRENFGSLNAYTYDQGTDAVLPQNYRGCVGACAMAYLIILPLSVLEHGDIVSKQKGSISMVFDTDWKLAFAAAYHSPTAATESLPDIAGKYSAFLSGDAKAAYALGEIALAPQQKAELLEAAAKGGYADAQYELGNIYKLGDGFARDQSKAVTWWREAAAQGHALACMKIADAYRFGKGVPRNETEARFWLTKAADAGNIEARQILYKESERDAVTASAKAGNRDAQVRLANIYRYGLDAPKNLHKAARLYALAASAGDDFAAYALGNIYNIKETGDPEIADPVRAYMWYSIAERMAADDPEDIRRLKNGVADTMPSNQITEAERLANEWLTQHPQ